MIDHLEIESRIIFAESKEGKEQIKKYGRDVEKYGNFVFGIKDYCNMCLADLVEEESFGSDDEANEEVKENSKKANQFAFIERASQTKQFDIQDAECQTDPPPM